MKLSSWNVNSVRARIDNILDYLKKNSPDILMIQEIKTEEINFPFEAFTNHGYNSYVHGQKSYNGVAILSKKKIFNIKNGLKDDKKNQARSLSAEIKIKNKNIIFFNIYIPNGNPINTDKYKYKLYWLDLFLKEVKKEIKINNNIILAGDFNIIPDEIDVYDHKKYENDALFKLEIRKKFRELINLGFQDMYRYFYKDKIEFTFWDYMYGSWSKNYGMRIDHFLVSNQLLDSIKSININKKPRSKLKPSDHTPIELEII